MSRERCRLLIFVIFTICCIFTETVGANVCSSESLPSYNVSSSGGSLPDNDSGGIQLVFPSWNFSCQGTIDEWSAHVIGNTSIPNSIEFQVLEPDPVNANIYHIVYGNRYLGNDASGTRIKHVRNVAENMLSTPQLPIRPGYIVGVYISPNVDLNLLYTSSDSPHSSPVDIYYWDNITERTCDLSLCDSKIIRGVTPLMGWIFRNVGDTAIAFLENTLQTLRAGNTQYCSTQTLLNCSVLPSETPSSSSSFPSSSLDIMDSSIFSSIISSTSMSTIQSLITTTTTVSTTTVSTTTVNIATTLLDSVISTLPANTPFPTSTTTSVNILLPASSSTDSFIPFSSAVTTHPSTTPTTTPTTDSFSSEVLVVMGVVVVLLLAVVILSMIVCICCLTRSKRVPPKSNTATQAFENPDYTGVISSGSGSVKRRDDFTLSIKNGSTQIPLPRLPQSTVPDTNSYYSQAGLLLQSPEEQRGTIDTRLCSPPAPGAEGNEIIDDYDIPKPSMSVINNGTINHYYSSPPRASASPPSTPPPPPPPSNNPYYSLLAENSPFIIDIYDNPELDTTDPSSINIIYDCPEDGTLPPPPPPPSFIPTIYDSPEELGPSNDEVIADGYDKIVLKEQDDKNVNKGPLIYAYVPTSEQRGVLDWRYEIPADQEYNKLNFFVQNQTFWKPAGTTTDLYAQLACYKYREVDRKEIIINNTLGEGQFGYVNKGLWTSPDGRHDVAVKTLKPDATEEDRVKILQEAAIMGQFSHQNIVKLFGVVTVGEPVMMILEFMPRGDLRTYLRSIRTKLGTMNTSTSVHLPKLLLKFCRDIASGMCYLSGKSFVHRDLAARNILLSKELSCKIGDFGMARDLMEDENNYYKSSGGIIPLKWTAPEALNFKKYTSSSDVWSYGMVLYEIWSLGYKPFNDLSNPIVIALVNSKHCQAPPPGCARAVYSLMVECWNPEYSKRLKFENIIDYLKTADDKLLQWSNKDMSVGKRVHILGAPLEETTDLFVDLQRTYQLAMAEQSTKTKN